MAKKFEIKGQSLVITDTVSGLEVGSFPKSDIYFDIHDLKDGQITLYDLSGVNLSASTVFKVALSDAVNSAGTVFTENSFKSFVYNNLLKKDDDNLNKSQYNELITTSKNQLINLKSIYGVSKLRDIVRTTGNATVTNEGGLYKLSTTANGVDSVVFDSAERGRYYASNDAEEGINVRIPVNPVGNQNAQWGYLDDQNGFGYGIDTTGLYIFDRSDGIETKVYQDNWNIDKLDGTGISGADLKPEDGLTYQIDFTWYSSGTINFEVVYYDGIRAKQRTYLVHELRKLGEVSVKDPNLFLRAKIDNAGEATPFDLYVGGRQFSIYGNPSAPRRITSERRIAKTGIGTTLVPLVTFRRKTNFASVSVKVANFKVLTDFDGIIEVRINSSLTGAVWQTPTNHSISETALESDISATAGTGGEVIDTDLVSTQGTGVNARGVGSLALNEQDFIEFQPVTIFIRRLTGTGGTATCLFKAGEEW